MEDTKKLLGSVAISSETIAEVEAQVKDIEGCLSFPKLWLHVKRYAKIKVRYQGITGELIESEFEGLLARVFQHEYDHLQGECFTEKVGKLSLDLAKKRRLKSR